MDLSTCLPFSTSTEAMSCVKNAASGIFLPANLPPLRCEVFHLTQGLVLIHPALLFLVISSGNRVITIPLFVQINEI